MQAVKRKKFNGQEACADNLALTPLPNSQKVYVTVKPPMCVCQCEELTNLPRC